MEWTKKRGNTVVTEYYIFDQEDDSADDYIIEMRYIGNNLHPLERLGVNRCMNGHDFFHTLAQQKKSTESIVFRTEVDFDNELHTNVATETGPKYLVTDDLKKVLKEKLDNDTDIPTLDTLSVLSAKIEKVMYPHGDTQADPEK